ncbi:MAG: dTDP-4-dehydrorhamnose 3,5-epimerase [Planctomycetes bacterium TMED75]|nr:dTDP-4-dehydrorhamnose 3,5-epimerase [Planctomycetaceae bacterium]OUU96961.1 MAG: dTDP-4-dehydrorhamnose 3,5-epimerase [Planctomycetes bacterium TMED75]
MKPIKTNLIDCLVLEPVVHGDDRGFFIESWNSRTFDELGLQLDFVQDNHSRSSQGVLRGLHFQVNTPQGKLVRVTQGSVFDVAVDLRRGSATFGEWFGTELSESNKRMLWVPPGFAHGFLVLSEFADFQYKCTEYYSQKDDRGIRWDDPQIGIDWPIPSGRIPLLSDKDRNAPGIARSETFE